MARPAALPLILLLAYAIAFGSAALGRGLPIYDDHPGQLYRLAHALTIGLAPWRWNPGWWAGYAELQFYPPGFFFLGALLHHGSLGALSLTTTYQVLLWLAYLLPGITTYLFLHRALASPWLALAGAFLALTLSAGSRSGVEEGLRWGLVAARLGWGLLPLLALSLLRWVEAGGPLPLRAAVVIAGVILTHPAHAPAAICMLGLAAWVDRASSPTLARRLARAAMPLVLACGLSAFWLLPLLARAELMRPLAWGEASLGSLLGGIAGRPLLVLLAAINLGGWLLPGRERSRAPMATWLLALAPAMVMVIALDVLVAQSLGIFWLPADRLTDSLLLALILGACVGLWLLSCPWPRPPGWAPALGLIIMSVALASGSQEPTLTLWPRAAQWPTYAEVARGIRLDELWAALRQAPPGRILFVRSAVPLEYGREWWRPHSHITALTPLMTGREILNGTFTHPSPIAELVYTGSAAPAPITLLVEQRDGRTLLGQPLERLAPETFDRFAERLRISVVVGLDEDEGRLRFLTENPGFAPSFRLDPFRLFISRAPQSTPVPVAPGRLREEIAAHPGGWMSSGLAYSPLWQARIAGAVVPTRQDDLGMLEVEAPAGSRLTLELEYRPGVAEWTGMALSGLAVLGLIALGLARAGR
jgi:hypothetical protein